MEDVGIGGTLVPVSGHRDTLILVIDGRRERVDGRQPEGR